MSVTREDVLAALGKIKGERMIVGFALETDDVEKNALDKLKRKHCDLIVVNNPHIDGAAFAHDTNVVQVYGPKGLLYQSDGPESKRLVAHRILTLVSDQDAFQKLLV